MNEGASVTTALDYNEARERSELFVPCFSVFPRKNELFVPCFSVFPRKNKTLHNGSYKHNVPKIKTKHRSVPGMFVCDSTS